MSFTESSKLRGAHRVAIAIGSNIGDRQGNVAAAIHKLHAIVAIDRISSVYETKPVGFTDQPDFLNLACTGTTDVPPRVLRDALAKIERQIGRRVSVPLGPRAIDLDLLLYDDLVMRDEDCTLPHPGLSSRAFVLVPLAEIAPNLVDPLSGKTIADLAARVDRSGVVRCEGGLLTRIRRDVQESRPQVPLSLNRAGITGVKTLIAVDRSLSSQGTTLATFDIYADLDAEHSGVHMSRFSQDLEDALADLAAAESSGVDELAVALARRVVESQRAERAEVHVRAPLALERVTPASALKTHEFYTMLGRAVATENFSRRLLGVEAEGMTACPCAQTMVADYSRERLLAEGFSEEQIAKILAAIPIATHNQRGMGTFMIGADTQVDVRTLVEIVEQSMSSETYDLLKRPDELFIVNKAHQAPRFVEDVVREMLRYAHDVLADHPDDAFVLARQINFESIHKHDAVAESCSTLGELRSERRGEPNVNHTTLEQWLNPGFSRREVSAP
jgi:GTP cyclohydrolase-4